MRKEFGSLPVGTYLVKIKRDNYDGTGDWFKYYVTFPGGTEQYIGAIRFPRLNPSVPASFNNDGGTWTEFWDNNGATLNPVPEWNVSTKVRANGGMIPRTAVSKYSPMPNSDTYAESVGGFVNNTIGGCTVRVHGGTTPWIQTNLWTDFADTGVAIMPSSAAPVVGTGAGQNAGVVLFDYLTGLPSDQRVSLNANTLNFTGTFWTQNAGWCTFGELGANGAKLTGSTDNLSMTGFAWCENAGWISFNPTGSISPGTDVYFTKSTGLFHGFAWSDNLGWISMEGLMTDITAPSPLNFATFSASGSKMFTLNDPSPTVPASGNYEFKITNWDSTTTTLTGASSPNFTHDFRQAKLYYLKITDPFGNSSEGNVQVVADVPSETLDNSHKIALGATETTYTGTFATSKVADGTQVHSLSLKLRDQYGNVVKNESTTDTPAVAIKTVTVSVAFNNTVSKDQVNIGGNAIKYPLGTIGLALGGTDSGTGSEDSGNYKLDIVSYAPTSSGYSFTTPGNNISLHKLTYEVTGVGGTSGQIEKKDKFGTNNLKFSPALYIGSVTNNDNWAIRQGYDSTFTATLLTGTTVPLGTPKVQHILGIYDTSGSYAESTLMSYQNPKVTPGSGTELCNGYMKTITTFNDPKYMTGGSVNDCYRPDSSNILLSNPSSSMSFSWKPTIIYAAPTNSTVKYSSEISYTTGSVSVKYPSYSRTNN